MDFLDNAWTSYRMHEIPVECMEFLRNAWECCGMHGIPVDCVEFLWNAWISTDIPEYQWI